MEVRIIEPTVLPLIQSEAIIRVCAYCRVSSSSKEQLNSYASQISYFKAFIDSQPNWRLVEIYTDKGVSGRKTKNRDEFNQMIDDAYRGLFDMIICKSISRFARDIVTSLKICRELREKGIDVFFEEENIHTLFLKNEHYLSVRSALAQSESENISTNTLWSIRRRMKRGTFIPSCLPLGYKLENKEIVKDKENERYVHHIFNSFINGMSVAKIAHYLNEHGVKSNKGTCWCESGIREILKNPIYTGELVLQKTYTDTTTFQTKINRGQLPRYHYHDNHEPYISKDIFEKVQMIFEIRREQMSCNCNSNKYKNRYPLSGIIECNQCGSKLKRVKIQKNNNESYFAYACTGHIKDKTKCSFKRYLEDDVYQSFIRLSNKLISNPHILKNYLKDLTYINEEADRHMIVDLHNQMEALYKKIENIDIHYSIKIYTEELLEELNHALLEQIDDLRKQYHQYIDMYDISKEIENTKTMMSIFDNCEISDEFNESLFEVIVQKIIAIDHQQLKFILINGLEIMERVGE